MSDYLLFRRGPSASVRAGRGRRVETYYLYHLHPNGRFAARDVIRAEDDGQAEAEVERLYQGYAMELWQGARKVKTFGLR